MAETLPRNWKAMREDRVLAMAENRFGRRFASKEAAIAELSRLPPAEQRRLRKTEVSTAERARRQGASDRMIRGMSQRAPMSKVDELAAKFQETMSKPTKDGLATLQQHISNARLTQAESQAFAKAINHPIASGSAAKIVDSISQRLGTLSSFLSKKGAGGRGAAALAMAVGVGAMLADAGGNQAAAASKKKQTGPSKNMVEAKKADAAAKQAEAEAAKANAETRRLELQAQKDAADRADKRREADKAPLEQARQIGLVAAPLAAGMVYGNRKANAIAAKVEKAAAAKNQQLAAVAKRVKGSKSPARMAAAVRVADELKLTKMKGPVGGLTAGFLVTEAAAARVVAANTENETAREVLNSAAIGLGAAAVSTVGTRLVQRATSSVLPNAGAMVEVETARENLKASTPQAKAAKRSMLAKAGRVALPALVGLAAAAAYSEARAEGADESAAGKQAAKAGVDVVTGGAISEYEKAKARGAGEMEAVATGIGKGAINIATFGVADMANETLKDQGGVAGIIAQPVIEVAKKIGGLLGWSDEAREAAAEARGAAAPGGEDPSAAAKIGGTIIGGTGLSLAALGFGKAADGKAYLNDSAARKAAQVPAAQAATGVATAPVQRTDGQTDSYTRRGRNGQTVQVKAYRTPTR
jgi:hypothetical protein